MTNFGRIKMKKLLTQNTIKDILEKHGPDTEIGTYYKDTIKHVGTVWFYNDIDKEVIIQSRFSKRPFCIDERATAYEAILIDPFTKEVSSILL